MCDHTVLANGTLAAVFRSPNSPNSELVFGQNGIRLAAFLRYYGQRALNILVAYSTSGVVPSGRHLDVETNNGQPMMAIKMNSIDGRPYFITPLVAEKIANTIANNGVARTIELLDKCREAVPMPVFLHPPGAATTGRPVPGHKNYIA